MPQAIQIQVRLFAQAAQMAASSRITLELPSSDPSGAAEIAIGQIAEQMCKSYPQMIELIRRSRWAVASEFVSEDFMVRMGQEVAMIPPVSGG